MNKLYLSKDLYKKDAIEKTVMAFSDLSTITAYDDSDYYICVFDKCTYEASVTIKEFENYLIDLCNKLGY